ncbi:MAG: hypothetical protein WDO24_24815 [Pseudomonadota bacterium]
MIVTVDTNVLVYAIAPTSVASRERAADLIDRGMRAGCMVFCLQTLAEFSHVAIRKAKIPPHKVRNVTEAWRAACPVQAATGDDLPAALDAVRQHNFSSGCDAVGDGAPRWNSLT